MTKITLHRASVDNSGNYLHAGTEIAVGPADDHIDADRAKDLLDTGGALEADPASKELATKATSTEAAPVPSSDKKA